MERDHVFLSYRHNDRNAAALLYTQLQRAGLSVFKDDKNIRWTERWLDKLQEAVDGGGAFVVLVGRDGVRRWIGAETQVALSRSFSPHDDAELARPQYDAVDPDNQLVAAELQRRWNKAFAKIQHRIGAGDVQPHATSLPYQPRYQFVFTRPWPFTCVGTSSMGRKMGWSKRPGVNPLKTFCIPNKNGGRGGIRTHGRVTPSLVFKTSALNHSATLPYPAPDRDCICVKRSASGTKAAPVPGP
jgi:hypothetical protein